LITDVLWVRSANGGGSERRLLIAALGIGLPSVCHLDRSLSLSCHPERNEVESKGLAPANPAGTPALYRLLSTRFRRR
jgi:hypothetical protein